MKENKQIEHLYIPNDIFEDLRTSLDVSTQRAFAYSYYYYVQYLYKYCKWIDGDGEFVTQDKIKELLGYSPSNKKINFIVKKNGTLDKLGYTETTNEYPLRYLYEEDFIIFQTNKTLKDDLPKGNLRNLKIKKPIRAFYATSESKEDGILDGTFYSVENSHRVNYKTFECMMKKDSLGCVAFYIYAYIKRYRNMFEEGLQRSYSAICTDLGFSEKTVIKYINQLEKDGYIRVERSRFHTAINEEDREANTYKIMM